MRSFRFLRSGVVLTLVATAAAAGGRSLVLGPATSVDRPPVSPVVDEVETGSRCGRGKLFYSRVKSLGVAGGPTSVLLGQLEQLDDFEDLVVLHGNVVEVRRGDGIGGFGAGSALRSLPASSLAPGALADFDEDGVLDLVVVDPVRGDAWRVPGTGDGLLQGPAALIALGGPRPRALAASDFDRDGHGDLATANTETNTVSIAFGLGNGSFPSAQIVTLVASIGPTRIVPVDADGDGAIDLVASGDTTAPLIVLRNTGGQFASTGQILVHPLAGEPWRDARFADLDRDGILDLLACGGSEAKTVAHRLAVPPALEHPAPWQEPGAGEGSLFGEAALGTLACSVNGLAAGDLDGGGLTDVVFSTGCPSNGLVAAFGARAGGFEPPVALAVPGHAPRTPFLVDLNRDGLLDIVAGSFGPRVYVALSRCRCAHPWSGDRCEECSGATCPGVGSPLEEQLIAGPPGTVAIGAALVTASTTRPTDERGAALVAQEIAAAALEADLVAVAIAVGKTVEPTTFGGGPFARTIVQLDLHEVLSGQASLASVEVVQLGGTIGQTTHVHSLALPFPDALCLVPNEIAPQYLVFLERVHGGAWRPLGKGQLREVIDVPGLGFHVVDRATNLTFATSVLSARLAAQGGH